MRGRRRDFRVLLPDELFPVQAFLNVIYEGRFVETVRELLRGEGSGFEESLCEFPADLEPEEDPLGRGIRFTLFEQEVILDRERFLEVLTLACRAHSEDYPEDRAELEALLRAARASAGLAG
jgi:hypothetical protein